MTSTFPLSLKIKDSSYTGAKNRKGRTFREVFVQIYTLNLLQLQFRAFRGGQEISIKTLNTHVLGP